MYLLALLTVSNDQWVREKKGEFSERKKSQEFVMQMNQSLLFSQYNFTNLTNRYSVKTGCLNKFKFEDEFVPVLGILAFSLETIPRSTGIVQLLTW